MEGPQPPASTNKGTTAPTMLNFKHTNLTPASMRSGPPTKRARSSAPTITIPSNPNPPKTSLSVLSEAAANTTPVPNKPKETIVVPSEPRPSSPPPVPVPRREIPTHMVINWDTFSQIRNGITTHFFNLWIKMLSSYYKEGIRKGFHLDLTLDEVHRYSSLAREWVVRHLKEDCSVKDHTDAITCTHFTTHAGLTLHTPASRYHGPAQQQMTWYEPACNVNGALAPCAMTFPPVWLLPTFEGRGMITWLYTFFQSKSERIEKNRQYLSDLRTFARRLGAADVKTTFIIS
jgi:hypothetical protein